MVFGLSLFLGFLVTLSSISDISKNQWEIIIIGPFVLQSLTFSWNKLRRNRAKRRAGGEKINYKTIGGMVRELRDIHIKTPDRRDKYTTELLNAIEKVIIATLRADGIKVGTICANIMLNSGGYLKLVEFGSKFSDRDKPHIAFDEFNPLPGAPQAWVKRKTVYIEDIRAKEYASYFSPDYKFRSFISVPIFGDGSVIAILNVDSNLEKQFKSNTYIAQNIEPVISPFLLLYDFEQELIKLQKQGGNNG